MQRRIVRMLDHPAIPRRILAAFTVFDISMAYAGFQCREII
jgi:hypothetical protein